MWLLWAAWPARLHNVVTWVRTAAHSLLAQAAPNPAADEQRCPIDPYVIEPDRSSYVDHQTLKLQEAPEDVPTGEMPRHVMLSVNRQLVDLVKPGTRVRVVGVSSVFTPKAARGSGMSVRRSFLKVVGIQVMGQGAGGAMATFTKAEEQEFRRMAADRDVYGHIWRSVAPAVSGGYTEDIKKAIACLLVGGSRRVLPDGMRLRGDINVLMLGDPSTAKSQFLKFVEKVAPVGVYTSGKGSSAAGLTASVTRDSRVRAVRVLLARTASCSPCVCGDGRASSTSKVAPWSLPMAVWFASMSSTRCERRIAWRSTKPWSNRPFRLRRQGLPPS